MKKILLIAGATIALASCYNDKFDKLYVEPNNGGGTLDKCDTATNPSTYSGNVKAIIDQSCAIGGCHDASTIAGGYDLSTHAGVKIAADNGLLMADINSGNMPKGLPKLSDCKIKQIQYWVNRGALNN